MSTIQTTHIDHNFEICVKYVESPAEPDVGCARTGELMSVTVCGLDITRSLSKEQYDWILGEILQAA